MSTNCTGLVVLGVLLAMLIFATNAKFVDTRNRARLFQGDYHAPNLYTLVGLSELRSHGESGLSSNARTGTVEANTSWTSLL